jgi:hypothetical protein
MSHAYFIGGLPKDATQTGLDAKAFIQEAMDIADTIHGVVAKAAKRLPGAAKLQIAREALAELIYLYPQLLVRETGMPRSAGPTLLTHIDAALDGSYPTGASFVS